MLAYCLGFLAISVAGRAREETLIAGCCDSITSEPSYLDLVWDVYGWPPGPDPWNHNLGVDASSSSAGLSRLESYLAAQDPDAVVVLAGTPDTFFRRYNEAATVENIAAMIEATLADGGEPLLVAPPPVFEPCDGSSNPTCAAIDGRLADLSVALEDLAFAEDVAFVNLYDLFSAHRDVLSLYEPDGVHPNHDVGDPFIADALLPELAALFCGNGILDPGEECDDGNGNPGDGCSASCEIEQYSGGLPMCKYKRGKQKTVLVPLGKVQRLLDKGLTLGECPNPKNGVVMCKSRRGKLKNVLVPHGKVQKSLDKGMTLGVCGAP
jgi:cysteine-rich repeat protein